MSWAKSALLFVFLRCFERGSVYLYGLLRIKNLNKQLCNLLLKAVGRRRTVKRRPLFCHFIQLDLVVIAITVPHRPIGIDAIRAVIINLVNLCLHPIAGYCI